jgi:hypothetical protein
MDEPPGRFKTCSSAFRRGADVRFLRSAARLRLAYLDPGGHPPCAAGGRGAHFCLRALRFGFSAGADRYRVQRGKELLLAYERSKPRLPCWCDVGPFRT